MTLARRWQLLVALAALAFGCSARPSPVAIARRAPAGEPEPGLAALPLALPSVTPTETASSPALERRTLPHAIGERLAFDWCMRGGTSFSPFGSQDGLPACSAIGVTITDARTDGDLETAVIELRPQHLASEEERYLFLRSGETIGLFIIAHGYSAGIGGFSHSIALENVRVLDVHGDTGLEWAAELALEEHDSDMGVCAQTGSERRELVLCTLEEGAFRCLQVPVVRNDYTERAAMSEGGECGPMRSTRKGFVSTVSLERGVIRFGNVPSSQRLPPFTRPVAAPFRGRVAIETLLAAAPARRVAPFR